MAFPLTAFTGTYWRILDGDIYVSRIGNDNIGIGSPSQPYATLSKAINEATTGKKIVVGTGTYNTGVSGAGKGQVSFFADGIVIIKSPALFRNMENNSKIVGFQFVDCGVAIFNSIVYLEDCRFINSRTGEQFGGFVNKCLFYKGSLYTYYETSVYNCTFFDSNVSSQQYPTLKVLESCLFCGSTKIYISSTEIQYFDYCNQGAGTEVYIDSVQHLDLLSVQNHGYQAYGAEVDPVFNNIGMLDFTLNSNSPLNNSGRYGGQIGAYGKSFSLHSPINPMNSFVLTGGTQSNIYLEPNSGDYVISNYHYPGTIETNVIDLGDILLLNKIFLYAVQDIETPPANYVVDNHNLFTHPNILTFQLRYSTKSNNLSELSYIDIGWNTIPTIDTNNIGNGELNFNSIENSVISARYIQFLITLKKPDTQLKTPIFKGMSMTYSAPNFSIQVQDIYGNLVSGAFITIISDATPINGCTNSQGIFLCTLALNTTYELIISTLCYEDLSMKIILIPETTMIDPNNNFVLLVKDQSTGNPIIGASVSVSNINGSFSGNTDSNGIIETNIDSSYQNTLLIEYFGYNSYQNVFQQFVALESLIPGFRIVPVIFLTQI